MSTRYLYGNFALAVKLLSMSTFVEVQSILLNFVVDTIQIALNRGLGKKSTHVSVSSLQPDPVLRKILTSRKAQCMYGLVFISLVTHRLWILHGISILLLDTMLIILYQWSVYWLDDPEVLIAFKNCRGWLALVMKEGDKVVSGKTSREFLLAFSVIAQSPSSVSFLRHALHLKMSAMRQELIHELGFNRFKLRPIFLLRQSTASFLESIPRHNQ